MIKNEIDLLAEYYQYELSYLRSAGSDFASKFPKIARRLDLSHNESSDPHVERLIESFAFLTGKLQKQIDDQFPEIANTLMDILYKPLVLPIPSCVMINFEVDQARAAKSPGVTVPKNTLLHTTSHTGDLCSFATSHSFRLWPAEIVSAFVVQKEHIPHFYATSTYYLKILLKYNGLAGTAKPKKLRFYINANALLRSKIFSALFSSEEKVLLQKNENFEFLSKISPVGLEDDENLFPYPPTIHKGFRLLQEYFSFPDKFYGFDITLPETSSLSGENFLYIPMSFDISMQLSEKNFSLSSVPAINLFPKITDPLRLDYKQIEYCLVPDYRRYHNNEIYTIEKMVTIDPNKNEEIYVPEFFSCGRESNTYCDDSSELPKKIFWKSVRKKTYMKDALGDDVHISFVDMDFNPQYQDDKIFYAYTLCTNRYVAEQIPVNGELQIELSVPVKKIYCIDRPTIQKPPAKNGEILWKLISALSLNSVSFSSHGAEKIRDVLSVFADISKSALSEEVSAIISVESTICTKRMDEQTWRGFIRGSEIVITFDESISNLGLPLSMVLSKFLTSFSSINTFTEVSVKNISKNGILKKWDQNFGIKSYL